MTSPEATIMTIADMSVIEAELKVDETDIVNLALGNKAYVKVDALPDSVFDGEVTEIGNSPLTTSTTSQEAKDFKVIITLEPSSKLRPGMSCTGNITTQTKNNVLVIPIQAPTSVMWKWIRTEVSSAGLEQEKPGCGGPGRFQEREFSKKGA